MPFCYTKLKDGNLGKLLESQSVTNKFTITDLQLKLYAISENHCSEKRFGFMKPITT